MAKPKPPAKDKMQTGELGQSGTIINYGQISGEEYNPDLLGYRKFQKYNEMRLGNASISTSLEAVKLPIISARYTVKPASDDPIDVEIAEKLDFNLFTHLDWKQVVRESLTYLDFGFSVQEEVYEAGEIRGTTMIILDKLGFRKQTTIEKFETQDHQAGVTQATANGHTASIPMNKLLLLSHKREGDNYEGVSLLRTAYANWYYVTTYYKIDAVGYERQALGVVDIEYPNGSDPKSIEALENAARNIRANGQSFISRPAGYNVGWMDMKAGTLKDPTGAIDHHIREIAKNVMAQFLEIGSKGSSGAYSSSQTQYELFILAVQAVADAFVDAFNRQVVKTWVDLNYNVTEYPKLQVTRIGDENMEAMVKSISLLVEAGVLTPTDEDEAFFRDKLDLPELPDELMGQDRNKKPVDTPVPPVDDPELDKGDVKKTKVKASAHPQSLNAQISSRDIPDLYEGTGVDPDQLGCIMVDVETLPVLEHVPDDFADDLVEATTRHDHQMGAVAEDEAHVTLLYGLLENGNVWKDKVDAVLDGWSMDKVEIEEVGYFETPDSFAVIAHVKLTSELVDGHERLTLLPHIQTFSEYHPHITLAYVSKDADIDDWVDYLGTAYNGKTVKATGLNYGDKPEPKKASTLLAQAMRLKQAITDRLYGPDKAA
jgi:2'-5' RNA ligase/phage gp29-like protein